MTSAGLIILGTFYCYYYIQTVPINLFSRLCIHTYITVEDSRVETNEKIYLLQSLGLENQINKHKNTLIQKMFFV